MCIFSTGLNLILLKWFSTDRQSNCMLAYCCTVCSFIYCSLLLRTQSEQKCSFCMTYQSLTRQPLTTKLLSPAWRLSHFFFASVSYWLTVMIFVIIVFSFVFRKATNTVVTQKIIFTDGPLLHTPRFNFMSNLSKYLPCLVSDFSGIPSISFSVPWGCPSLSCPPRHTAAATSTIHEWTRIIKRRWRVREFNPLRKSQEGLKIEYPVTRILITWTAQAA